MDPLHIFHRNSNSVEISFYPHLNCNKAVATKVYNYTTVLTCHVQNFDTIWWSVIEIEQGGISIDFELRAKESSVKYTLDHIPRFSQISVPAQYN